MAGPVDNIRPFDFPPSPWGQRVVQISAAIQTIAISCLDGIGIAAQRTKIVGALLFKASIIQLVLLPKEILIGHAKFTSGNLAHTVKATYRALVYRQMPQFFISQEGVLEALVNRPEPRRWELQDLPTIPLQLIKAIAMRAIYVGLALSYSVCKQYFFTSLTAANAIGCTAYNIGYIIIYLFDAIVKGENHNSFPSSTVGFTRSVLDPDIFVAPRQDVLRDQQIVDRAIQQMRNNAAPPNVLPVPGQVAGNWTFHPFQDSPQARLKRALHPFSLLGGVLPEQEADRLVDGLVEKLNRPEIDEMVLFLHRFPQTRDYQDNQNLRVSLFQRLKKMLDEMLLREPFREEILKLIPSANTNCANRVTEFLDKAGVKLLLLQEGISDQEYMKIVIAERRLHLIDGLATIKHPGGEVLQWILVYRLRLKEALSLPIQTQGILHPNYANLSEEEIEAMQASVLSLTDTREQVLDILMESPDWTERLQRRYPDPFEKINEESGELLDQIMESELTGDDQRKAIGGIVQERKEQIQAEVRRMTEAIIGGRLP